MTTCIATMKQKLAVLHPLFVDIVDESHKHAGHAGARSGGGHYLLQIISADFAGKSKMVRHRMIYSALAEIE
jgi:BolA protein